MYIYIHIYICISIKPPIGTVGILNRCLLQTRETRKTRHIQVENNNSMTKKII